MVIVIMFLSIDLKKKTIDFFGVIAAQMPWRVAQHRSEWRTLGSPMSSSGRLLAEMMMMIIDGKW